MKKIYMFMASAALMFAVSCNKEEINVDTTAPVETELITVDLNPMTKTALGAEGATTWDADDVVSVTVDGKKIGDLKWVEGSTFSGEVEAGHNGAAQLHYPSGVTTVPTEQTAVAGTFADGAALLDGETTMDALRAGEGVTLSNSTALLKFETSIAGDVAFAIGNKTYTVEGCEVGNTYYACVDPEITGKLTYTVGIVVGANEKADFTPVANKVYPLGKLALKQSTYGVVGDNNGWADSYMYETTEGDNFFVLYNVEFAAAGGFKVRKGGEWNDDYNFGTTTTAKQSANEIVGVYTDGGSKDIEVNAGMYDIYFDRLAGQVYIMTPGKSYTEATAQTTTSYYSLAGSFTGGGWDDTVAMKYSGDGVWTNVQDFKANDEFKVKIKDSWDSSWGYNNVYPGSGLVTNSNGNAKLKTAGTYVVGFYLSGNKITLVNK